MSNNEIYNGIKDILHQKYGISPNKITEESAIIEDIGIVSLEFMNFILDIEKKFDIIYNFEVNISTIKDLMTYIIAQNDK